MGASHVFLSQIFQFRNIIIEGDVFFPYKRLTCFENKVKRSIECKQLLMLKKEGHRDGNLSVEFICSTVDLNCAVKNVEGSVSLPARICS